MNIFRIQQSTSFEDVSKEVDSWRRDGDSNPGYGYYRTHDFQSCSFGQLGHLSIIQFSVLNRHFNII